MSVLIEITDEPIEVQVQITDEPIEVEVIVQDYVPLVAGTATPLPSGDPPTVEIEKVGQVYELNLGIPAGAQGDTGAPGYVAQPTAPADTTIWWFDTSTGATVPRFYDPVSGQWLPATSAPILYFNQSGNYTAQIQHLAYLVDFDGTTFTLPNNATVPLPVGFWLIGRKRSTSTAVTVVAGAGVTIESANNALRPFRQFSSFTAIKIAINTWALSGDLIV
jgi:hypothetical protein